MEHTVFYILLIMVMILYLPMIVIIVTLMPISLMGRFYKNRSKSNLLLATLGLVLQKATRGGVMRYCVYNISKFPSNCLRKMYYRTLGADIGKRVTFHFLTEIRSPWFLKIGDGSIIGDNAILDARSNLTIGKNVNLSSNVSIYTLQHNHRSPLFDCDFNGRKQSVEIGDRAWLGSNVIVLPGVSIGEGAVICSGAVVTKDVHAYDVMAGIPAKKVGVRPCNLIYEFDGKSCWFY